MGGAARGLAFRLVLLLTGAVAVLLGAYGLWAARESRTQLEARVIQNADRICDVIRRGTRSFMFRNERVEIFEIIQAIGEQPGMDRIRIYDQLGQVRYSTHAEDVGRAVDTTAEACIQCHQGDTPAREIPPGQRYRIFRSPDGHRTLGMIAPIENEPSCSQAPCHVHPADQRILGVLDVQMSLADIDRGLAEATRRTVGLTAVVVAVIAGLLILVVYRMVHRPVKALIAGTQRVASGDLDHRLAVGSSDELGELATSFNHMTVELAEAQRLSNAWAATLEARVEEKSKALVRAQEEAVRIEKLASMGKLAAIVAHEINNPLAGIRTYAKLLLKRRAGQPGDEAEMLQMVESEAARCGEIVKHLLQFSRPSRPRAETCDVNELVRGSVRLVQHQIDLKGIASAIELDPVMPAIVCDPQQIRQALVAILINAVEAMVQEGSLTVATRAEADGWVSISIRDTGVGIDPETRKHLFEPFYTTKEEGGGLGLAVVHGIVQSHGGRIDVESAPAMGTLFRIHLPPAPPERNGESEVKG
jgi:two-component system NtrC family sensor kinase